MFKVNLTTILIAVIAVMGITTYSLHKQNKAQELLISQLYASIQENNAVIKSLEVDLDKFKKQAPIIKEKIINRYIKVQAKDESCEAQLKAVDELVKAWEQK